MLNNTLIIGHEQFHTFEQEWNKIHKKSSKRSILSSFKFVEGWYSCFKDFGTIRVYRIRSGSDTLGFMPLILRRQKGIRVLQNLWEMEIGNPEPVVMKGREKDFQELLLNRIVESKHEWDVFRYHLSYSFSLFPGMFTDNQLAQTGLRWIKERGSTYAISLNKSFEGYFQKDFGKKLRRNYNLSNNRLQKHGDYSFFHIRGREAVNYWPLFLELEGSGWKGDRGTAISKIKENKKRYYDLLINTMAESGNLSMYFLKIDQNIAAGSFGYLDGDIYHEAKSAYDEKYSFFSPSNLLRIYMIKDIISRVPQIKRVHMFPWDYGYKQRWNNEDQVYTSTTIYSSSFRGRLVNFFKSTKQSARENNPALYRLAKKIRDRLHGRKD